jgi:hypothetical protein
MSRTACRPLIASSLLLALAACASVQDAPVTSAGERVVEGTIVSIDTQPWTYDGNAIVVVDTGAQRQVSVELPARWNLCAAAPVNVDALSVGMRVVAAGDAGEGDSIVVCQQSSHRLAPAP